MGTTTDEECNLVFYVDKFRNDNWKEKRPWKTFIDAYLKTGKKLFIVKGENRTMLFGTSIRKTP
jgi:hypothetical protein